MHPSLKIILSACLFGGLSVVTGEGQDNSQPGAETNPVSLQKDLAPFIDLSGKDSPSPIDAAADPTPGTGPVTPPVPGVDGKSRMGEEQVRSRVVEKYKAEKFFIYPDDPDSAWWETNVRHAFARSQREMKPLLLLFTAIWRPEAMNLSEEVFSTKSFNEYVKKNLVICYLAYPPNVRDAPPSMQWAKKEFKVAGYPNVLIFNSQGEVVRAIRGYRKGRPVDYFNELKAACAPALASIEQKKQSLTRYGFRDWHNPEGRVLFAKFVKRDDRFMTLKDSRGQDWTIAIDQLSKEDQMMARSFPRVDEVEDFDSP